MRTGDRVEVNTWRGPDWMHGRRGVVASIRDKGPIPVRVLLDGEETTYGFDAWELKVLQ